MSKKAAKIAISLPVDLLSEADHVCSQRGETRSEFVRAALKAFIADEQRRQDVERYVKSYSEQPEQEANLAGLRELGLQVLAKDPWE